MLCSLWIAAYCSSLLIVSDFFLALKRPILAQKKLIQCFFSLWTVDDLKRLNEKSCTELVKLDWGSPSFNVRCL